MKRTELKREIDRAKANLEIGLKRMKSHPKSDHSQWLSYAISALDTAMKLIEPLKGRPKLLDESKVKKLQAQGLSQRAIAKKLSVSLGAVQGALRRL